MFTNRTSFQSESDFIKICFLNASTEQKKVAIAIRHAIADLGKIENNFIRAEVSFEDLGSLPFWSSCGDAGFNTTRFVEAIEAKLGVQFTEEQLRCASVRDPDLNVYMKIHEFVSEFYDWYNSLTESR